MELYPTKIIESIVVLCIFIFIRIVSSKLINKTIDVKSVQKSRSQLIRKSINFITSIIGLFILLIIWGVKQSELAVFVGSVLTIVGVAMFAQWSLLSNITSSIIIFFNHSVKIGDSIIIMETKDYEIRGEVLDIGLFFTSIKMIDTDEEITLPNNIFIQKTIRKANSLVRQSQDNVSTHQEQL